MIVLAVDTSQRIGGVALARDGALLGEARFGSEASHLVELGAAVERLLRGNGLGVADIGRVALVAGPGSFTGLRIGMAWAKGLHAGAGIDLATIGTLELMALPHLDSHPSACVMLDARKREVYAAVYARPDGAAPFHGARVATAPCAMPAARFAASLPEAPAVLVGSGVLRYRDEILRALPGPPPRLAEPLDAPPPVSHLARVGHRLAVRDPGAVPSLEPDYIRSSEAELKKLRETKP